VRQRHENGSRNFLTSKKTQPKTAFDFNLKPALLLTRLIERLRD
jgi:hypothetical protein